MKSYENQHISPNEFEFFYRRIDLVVVPETILPYKTDENVRLKKISS
jgi:hypothetical protein